MCSLSFGVQCIVSIHNKALCIENLLVLLILYRKQVGDDEIESPVVIEVPRILLKLLEHREDSMN